MVKFREEYNEIDLIKTLINIIDIATSQKMAQLKENEMLNLLSLLSKPLTLQRVSTTRLT